MEIKPPKPVQKTKRLDKSKYIQSMNTCENGELIDQVKNNLHIENVQNDQK